MVCLGRELSVSRTSPPFAESGNFLGTPRARSPLSLASAVARTRAFGESFRSRGSRIIRYLSISIRLYIPLALCLSMRYEYSTIVHDEHVSDVYVYAPPLTQSQTLSLSLSVRPVLSVLVRWLFIPSPISMSAQHETATAL